MKYTTELAPKWYDTPYQAQGFKSCWGGGIQTQVAR
jgi:hypothetical protein